MNQEEILSAINEEETLAELFGLADKRKSNISALEEIDANISHQIIVAIKTAENKQGIADILYWDDLGLGNIRGVVKDAFNGIVGKKFKPTPLELDLKCPVCGEGVSVKSLTKLKEMSGKFSPKAAELCCNYCYNAELSHFHHPGEIIIYPNPQIHALVKMSYSEYLQTDYWKLVREMIIRRDKECVLCGGNSHLNVHHKDYYHRGFESYNDLTVLCGRCHSKFHDKGQKR